MEGADFDKETIGEAIERQTESHPDHIAFVFSGAAPLSYGELLRQIRNIRSELRAAGFGPGARIVVGFPSGPQGALALVAVSCSAVALPVNLKHSFEEIEACFAALEPHGAFLLRGSDSMIRRVAHARGVPIIEGTGEGTNALSLRIVGPIANASVLKGDPHQDPPAFILQSSGTTSKPKLIPISHRNVLAGAARTQRWFGLTPRDRCLCASPIHYAHGLKVTVLTPLLTGGSVAFPGDPAKFDPAEWFGALKPTWYSAVPTLHRRIHDQLHDHHDVKHDLRFILSGGAPLQADILDGLRQSLGVPVLEIYGASETGQMAANLPSAGGAKPGTVGTACPGTLAIVDAQGASLPPGERGEIIVRGATVISGYYQAPELNRSCFVDGWFKTGDIGSLDADGFLLLHGRHVDVINRGGEKISPAEIDAILMSHPDVVDAAAFATPHARLGEDVAAAVVLKAGTTAGSAQLRAYLGGKLAFFKVPRRIIVVDGLPKSAAGKTLRRQLSARYEAAVAVESPAPDTFTDDPLSIGLMKVWERLLNQRVVGLDSDFFESGGDSLLALEMTGELERLIGRKVPPSILFEASTIRQLTRAVADEQALRHRPLVKTLSGSRTPLFFFHGAFNTGGGYVKRLSELMGPDQPLYVVNPHGLDDLPIPGSLAEMAADRAALVRQAQQHGPYRLAGYCLSGLVAFETARLLMMAGETVDFVVMIDPPTLNARLSVQRLLACMAGSRSLMGPSVDMKMARAWYKLAAADRSSSLRRQMFRAWGSLARLWLRWATGGNRPQTDPDVAPNKSDQYAMAMARYRPHPLAVPVFFFASENTANAWSRISPGTRSIKLEGDHGSIVTDPTEVACNLRRLLDR